MGNNSNATQSTATASGGVALSVVVFVQWILSLYHVDLPADAATALGVIIGAGVHFLVVKNIVPPDDDALTEQVAAAVTQGIQAARATPVPVAKPTAPTAPSSTAPAVQPGA